MEGFLNCLPKFNNSLLDLLFLVFSIKTVSFREFCYSKIAKPLYFQAFRNSNILVSVTPTRSSSGTRTSCFNAQSLRDSGFVL